MAAISTVIWLACLAMWFQFGERRMSSPLLLYLAFHLLNFVMRPWFLYYSRDESYLREWIKIWLFPEDHTWTIWLASVGLITFTVGSLLGELRARSRGTPTGHRTIDRQAATFVGVILLVLGFASYVRYGVTPWGGTANSEGTRRLVAGTEGYTSVSTSSAYITSFYVVIVGVFLVWISYRGFRWYYAPVLGAYFFAIMLNGASRTTYLIGAIAVMFAIMGWRGRRWPSWGAALVGGLFVLSFLSGKAWLQTLLFEGRSEGYSTASERLDQSTGIESELFINYDTLAATAYLVPNYAPHTDISLFLRPLYFWVPRAIWPDKPIYDYPAAYLFAEVPEISFQGLTVTMVGESYLGFGIVGVAVLMMVYGFALSYAHARAFLYPSASVERIFGLAVSATVFQVYRDGILSFPLYMLFYFGPCLMMLAASTVLSSRRADRPVGARSRTVQRRTPSLSAR